MTETSEVHGSVTVTEGIRVQVTPRFEPGRSLAPGSMDVDGMPQAARWVFAYRIEIENVGDEPARLVSRRWEIRDADGDSSDVEGPGVVGYQPTLLPGESFEYESWCPLSTPWGTMEGAFQMERLDEAGRVIGVFEAAVGRFYLVGASEPAALEA